MLNIHVCMHVDGNLAINTAGIPTLLSVSVGGHTCVCLMCLHVCIDNNVANMSCTPNDAPVRHGPRLESRLPGLCASTCDALARI